MKKFFALLVALLSALTLFGCSDDDSIPEGMQLVNGSDSLGYYFYAPEEWTVANLGYADATYVSALDNTSITFTEIDPKTFSHSDEITDEAYFFSSYFKDSLSEFPEGVTPNITVNGEKCLFGTADAGADNAIKYVYDYKYKNVVYDKDKKEYTYTESPFGFMQILLSHEGRFYIFTYSGQKSKLNAESDALSRYETYIQNGKLDSVINNFKLVTKKGEAEAEKNYEKDSDGFIRATDKSIAGFEMYLPTEFKIDFSSAIVSATASDGSNVTLTRSASSGISASEYWSKRKLELEAITTELKIIKEPNIKNPDNTVKLGNNSQWAFDYEYTYVYNGTTYHVYQILAVDGFSVFGDGYAFTYTATEENYAKHLDDVKKIISKVNF